MMVAYEQYAGIHNQTQREIGMLMTCCPLWFGELEESTIPKSELK